MTTAGVVSNQGARLTAAALNIAGPNQHRAAKGRVLNDKDGNATHMLGQSAFRVEQTIQAEVITSPGEAPRLEARAEKRIRMTDAPFDRLRARGELARDDADLSRILGVAGARYAKLSYDAGQSALKAFDLSKGFSTARGEMSDAAAERRAIAASEFRAADDVLAGSVGHALHALPRALVVRKVILEEMALVDVGRMVGHANDKAVAAGIALHELKQGLRALAVHFGLLTEARAEAA